MLKSRLGAAHARPHPTWREKQQRARVTEMTGGETPHQGIEGGLAGPINLVAAGLVVANAALTGRHDSDGALRRQTERQLCANCGHPAKPWRTAQIDPKATFKIGL